MMTKIAGMVMATSVHQTGLVNGVSILMGGELIVKKAREKGSMVYGDCLNVKGPFFVTNSDNTCVEFFFSSTLILDTTV